MNTTIASFFSRTGLAIALIYIASPNLLCVAQDTVKIIQRTPLRSTVNFQRPLVVMQGNGPDLRIMSVTGTPSAITTLDANGECPFFIATVEIKNTGNQDAWFPANSWVIGGESQYTNISSTQITNVRTTARIAIRPNETFKRKLAGKVKCLNGNTVTISFSADPDNLVSELNEANNVWVKSVPNQAVPNLSQKPDLVVHDVWFTPENPDYYSRVTIHVELRNTGPGSAVFCQGASTIWMAYIENQNGGSGGAGARVIVPNETIGGGLFISESGELQNGCYRVVVKVDPNNAVDESDETNNSFTAYLSIGGASCQTKIDEDRRRGWSIVKDFRVVPMMRITTEPMIKLND